VIRLNLGIQQPTLIEEDERSIKLRIMPRQKVVYRNLWYLGKVRVNLIGVWRKGFRSPLWVMTDLNPEEGLRIYRQRMKIDENIRDFKNLLRLEKVMNERQDNMTKMVGVLL
jgi:hypothetical protein